MWRALPSCQSSSIQSTTTIPRSKEVDMEAQTEYRVGGFHPIELGDVLNTRYRVVRKLGYGRYSTVWLVEDNQYFNTLKD